jgi:hypothetical protein
MESARNHFSSKPVRLHVVFQPPPPPHPNSKISTSYDFRCFCLTGHYLQWGGLLSEDLLGRDVQSLKDSAEVPDGHGPGLAPGRAHRSWPYERVIEVWRNILPFPRSVDAGTYDLHSASPHEVNTTTVLPGKSKEIKLKRKK